MINDYNDIKECIYKEEHYSVRDNVKYMHVNGLDYVKSII